MPQENQSSITEEKLEKYYSISSKALTIIKSSITKGRESEAKEILEMVECYLKDSKHFQKNNNYINAFACINYAHGWIDCACRLKIFKVNDSKIFAVSEEN